MKILYLACHEGLQYDEIKLFRELGHEVECIAKYGSVNKYSIEQRPDLIAKNLTGIGANNILLEKEDIEKFDMIYVTHYFEWVLNNWDRIRHKKVLMRYWQSEHHNLPALQFCRSEGLVLVRYSEHTQYSPPFYNNDCVIRAYKDPDEFKDWNGQSPFVMTACHDMNSRPQHCYLSTYLGITESHPRKLFGRNNEVLGIDGGMISYEELKNEYRNNRAYMYVGTHSAPYTLNFIEAMMTGIPVVAIGSAIADFSGRISTEVPKFIKNGVDGFISNDAAQLRDYLKNLLEDIDLAKEIGKNGREKAIKLFGKDAIKQQWENLFNSL